MEGERQLAKEMPERSEAPPLNHTMRVGNAAKAQCAASRSVAQTLAFRRSCLMEEISVS